AGHAQRRRVVQCGTSGAKSLFERHWWNRFIDQRHCLILENASEISIWISHDDSARDIGGFRSDAGQLHRCRIRERLVSVVALNKHWDVTCEWVHEFFSRK